MRPPRGVRGVRDDEDSSRLRGDDVEGSADDTSILIPCDVAADEDDEEEEVVTEFVVVVVVVVVVGSKVGRFKTRSRWRASNSQGLRPDGIAPAVSELEIDLSVFLLSGVALDPATVSLILFSRSIRSFSARSFSILSFSSSLRANSLIVPFLQRQSQQQRRRQ